MGSRTGRVLVVLLAAFLAVGVALATVAGAFGFLLHRAIRASAHECGEGHLHDPPDPSEYGTPAEICARGDDANPRAHYRGTFPSDPDTQERQVGGRPARFSGYTTWIDSVTLVPASRYVDGYAGAFVRIEVRTFNRDMQAQPFEPDDFALWRRDEGFRSPDFVGADDELRDHLTLPTGATVDGALYLYVGEPRGDVFVRYVADGDETMAVWQVLDDGQPVG